jgi:hypothetical protein
MHSVSVVAARFSIPEEFPMPGILPERKRIAFQLPWKKPLRAKAERMLAA